MEVPRIWGWSESVRCPISAITRCELTNTIFSHNSHPVKKAFPIMTSIVLLLWEITINMKAF